MEGMDDAEGILEDAAFLFACVSFSTAAPASCIAFSSASSGISALLTPKLRIRVSEWV